MPQCMREDAADWLCRLKLVYTRCLPVSDLLSLLMLLTQADHISGRGAAPDKKPCHPNCLLPTVL